MRGSPPVLSTAQQRLQVQLRRTGLCSSYALPFVFLPREGRGQVRTAFEHIPPRAAVRLLGLPPLCQQGSCARQKGPELAVLQSLDLALIPSRFASPVRKGGECGWKIGHGQCAGGWWQRRQRGGTKAACAGPLDTARPFLAPDPPAAAQTAARSRRVNCAPLPTSGSGLRE